VCSRGGCLGWIVVVGVVEGGGGREGVCVVADGGGEVGVEDVVLAGAVLGGVWDEGGEIVCKVHRLEEIEVVAGLEAVLSDRWGEHGEGVQENLLNDNQINVPKILFSPHSRGPRHLQTSQYNSTLLQPLTNVARP